MKSIETGSTLRFSYQKTSAEIKTKIESKIIELDDKIKERENRIAALRKEYEIDDSDLVQLLTAARRASQKQESAMTFSYTRSNIAVQSGGTLSQERTIGAGVVNNLLTENDFIESERDAVKNLLLILRNLQPLVHYNESTGGAYTIDMFQLGKDELEYLGF